MRYAAAAYALLEAHAATLFQDARCYAAASLMPLFRAMFRRRHCHDAPRYAAI